MLWQPGQWRSCTTPRIIEKVGAVACGQCVNCGKARVKDWVGRNLLEAGTADYSLFATLTIGGDRMFEAGLADNVRALRFHPDDVRAYLKRVRWFIVDDWRKARKLVEAKREYLDRHGMTVVPEKPPRVRYFLVGENGDQKGRVHYHLLMHFYGCKGPSDLVLDRFLFHGKYPPGVVCNACIVDPEKPRWDFSRGSGIDWVKSERTYWPFGMVRYQEFVPAFAYYVTSYAVKALGDAVLMRPGISRAPLLGAYHLDWLAGQHVDQMISPQKKTFCVVRDEGYVGHNPEYWLSEAAARHLCRTFVLLWGAAHRGDPAKYSAEYPYSDLVDEVVSWDADRAAVKAARKAKQLRVREQVEADFWEAEERRKRRHREGLPDDLFVPSLAKVNLYRRLKEGNYVFPGRDVRVD